MLDRLLKAQAWKSCEWLIRRFRNRDDAQEILRWLHVALENEAAWSAMKALVAAIRGGNALEVMVQWEIIRRAAKERGTRL